MKKIFLLLLSLTVASNVPLVLSAVGTTFYETPTGKMETSGEVQARPLRPHLVLDPVTAKVDPSEGVGSGVGSPFRPAPTRVTDDSIPNVTIDRSVQLKIVKSMHDAVQRAEEAIHVEVQELLDTFDCHHFYLDMGTNIGVQIRKLYEPNKYPKAQLHKVFDVAFGETGRCKVCSIGIEPNPTHFEWHGKLQGALRGAGAGVLVISGAAGSNTGVSEFYFSGTSKSDDLEVGASTTAAHGVKNGNMLLEHVQIVDVPKLIHILHAHLVLRGAGKRKGVILAKSDIEGSEYSLLPSLVLTQTFCLIDYIFTEWHGNKYSRDVLDIVASEKQVQRDRSGSARFQKYISRVRDFFKAPFNIFFNAPFYDASCKTRVLEVDDETYVADGMPLPTTSVC